MRKDPDFQDCDGPFAHHSACNVANTRLGQGEDVAPTVVPHTSPLSFCWLGCWVLGRSYRFNPWFRSFGLFSVCAY